MQPGRCRCINGFEASHGWTNGHPAHPGGQDALTAPIVFAAAFQAKSRTCPAS
jgi:hypothetical protein